MDVTDEQSFEEWYRAQRPRVVATLFASFGDRDLAAEATDEAFARLLTVGKDWQELENPVGWVFRVALNQARRVYRRRMLEARLLRRLYEPPQFDGIPDRDLWSIVAQLPSKQKTVVLLRYLAALTEPEIAAITGTSRGTVSSNLADARRHLAEILSPCVMRKEERHA